MITYDFGEFMLKHDPESGWTETRYPDGTNSFSAVVPGDEHHAPRLGITPELHRLEHELMHHVVGLRYYRSATGSPVVWRDAHGTLAERVPDRIKGAAWSEAKREEWVVTSLQYLLHGRVADEHFDRGVLIDLEREAADPSQMIALARWLVEAPTWLGSGGPLTSVGRA